MINKVYLAYVYFEGNEECNGCSQVVGAGLTHPDAMAILAQYFCNNIKIYFEKYDKYSNQPLILKKDSKIELQYFLDAAMTTENPQLLYKDFAEWLKKKH